MTLKWWANQLKNEDPELTECYVAVMPDLFDDGTGTYHLEVEVEPWAEIIGMYDTGIRVDGDAELEEAHNAARRLGEELRALGVKVYATREEWENNDAEETEEA